MATEQKHTVFRLLFHLLLATGAISSAEHNGRILTEFASATQSSTFDTGDMLCSAQKALDGCYNKTCTARTNGEKHNWIRLDLRNVYRISSVVIYAVTEESCLTCSQRELTGINVEMSNILALPQCVVSQVTTDNQKIVATIQGTDDGHSLPDSRYITLTRTNHPLTIAEIQVYGGCPDSYCGRNCSKFCFCETPLTTAEKTGGQSCHDGCLEGWEGEMCNNRKCMEGSFGLDCHLECRCVIGCDPWTGECLGADRRCYSGFSGSSCQKQDLNPVYQKSGSANDGNQSTCINLWMHEFSMNYPIRPSFVEITYKSGEPSNQQNVQLLSSSYIVIPYQASKGIGCGNKRQQLFQFHDVNISMLTIQNIRGELCEIRFFVCAYGTFGPDCNSRCHCLNHKPCNKIDGSCPDGKCALYWEGKACDSRCSNGTFGEDCSRLCHCINNQSCNYETGKCPSGCSPGWTDIVCNKPCSPGSFGFGCLYACGHCTGGQICHHINGNCSGGCEEGWQGPRCIQQRANDRGKAEYDNEFDEDITSSRTTAVTDHTEESLTGFESQNKSDKKEMLKISGGVGSVVIFITAVVILCLVRFRKKNKSRRINRPHVLEERNSVDTLQHINENVQETATNAEQHNYYNIQYYETLVKRGINIPVTQFLKICKTLLAASKNGKPPLFYAFQSLQASEHVYERVDQGITESADLLRLSYKALVLRHEALSEQPEASFGQSSRKLVKINDISFLVSDDSVTCVSFWETLVEQDITTCVHIGQPTIKKDEKLTFGSFTIECTSWKETDSVTECKLIAQSLESELVRQITMLSCATWEEFMEVPIDLLGVINLTENLYNDIDQGGNAMIQCEHSINKAVLLSVVSAILFKMRSTGLVDILGPVHDARLDVSGSIATYEQFKFLHDVVLFAIQKKRCCKEDTVERHQTNMMAGV